MCPAGPAPWRGAGARVTAWHVVPSRCPDCIGGSKRGCEGFNLSQPLSCSHLGCIVRNTEQGGGGGGGGCWRRRKVRPHRFYMRPTEPTALSSRDRLGPPLSWAQARSSPGLCQSPHRSPLAASPAHFPGILTRPLQVQGAGVDVAGPGNCAGPATGLGLPKRSWQGPQGEGGQGRGERRRAGRPQAPAKGGPSPAHPCPSHLDSGFWRPEPGQTALWSCERLENGPWRGSHRAL